MKKIKTSAVLSFIALLSFGVASCFNPTGPGKETGTGDTVRHGGKLPVDTLRDSTHIGDSTHFRFHHRFGGNDTLIKNDTIKPPPPDTTHDSLNGGLDSTLLDSLLHH